MNTEKDFWKSVKKTKKCWIWLRKTSNGYGFFGMKGRGQTAHRWAYEFVKGRVPKGLQVDHLCRNRRCVNPKHLEAVTLKENILRGKGITAENAKKQFCKRGHPFTPINTTIKKRGRDCKKCAVIHQLKYNHENPEYHKKGTDKWKQKNREYLLQYHRDYSKAYRVRLKSKPDPTS